MAIQVNIEKNFKGFSLKSVFESNTSATGILGASGSGKSMTLRCIAGIETPDRGKIVIKGRTVFDSEKKINLKPQERRIGYLFQNYALFPTMTVKDNILCGYRGEKGQREEKARDFMKRYQLEGLENRYPSQLSGGQQQRVALARMMIGEPEAILLDDPFSCITKYQCLASNIIFLSPDFLLHEGDALPSVRQLASIAGINMHTVNKAYALLRQEGFVTIDRRKGAVISIDADKVRALEEMKQNLTVAMAWGCCKNVTREEVHQLVDEIFDEYDADR